MMKKRLMKSFAALLSVAIVLSGNIQTYASELNLETGSAINLLAKDGELTYNDFTYTIDENDEITIISYNGTAKDVTVPARINGKKVVKIEDLAFLRNKTLENVVLEDGIKTIGKLAFRSCSNLKNISIPESMTYIRTCAFEFCTSLPSITVPKDCEFEYYDDNNLPFPNMTGTGNAPFVVKSYTGSKAWEYIKAHYYHNGSYGKPGYSVYYENLDYVPLERIEFKELDDIALGDSIDLNDCFSVYPENADVLADLNFSCHYSGGQLVPGENGIYTPTEAGPITIVVSRKAGSNRPDMCRNYPYISGETTFKVIDTSLVNAKTFDIYFDNEELTGTETNIVTGKTIRVDMSKIQKIDFDYLFDNESVNEGVNYKIDDNSVFTFNGATQLKMLSEGTATLTLTTKRSNLTASVTLEVYSTGAESITLGGTTSGYKEVYIEDKEKVILPIELVADSEYYDELYDEIEVSYSEGYKTKKESDLISYDIKTGEITVKSLGPNSYSGNEVSIYVKVRGKRGAIIAGYRIKVKTKILLMSYGYNSTMKPNDRWQFKYTVSEEAEGTYYTVLKSNDDSVIEISDDNLVTAKAIGSTEIVFSIYTTNNDYLICEEVIPIEVVSSPLDDNNNSDNNNDANNNDNNNSTDSSNSNNDTTTDSGNTNNNNPTDSTTTDSNSSTSNKEKKPSKVSITKVKAGKKRATVKWKKVSGASGYQVYQSTKKNRGYKKIATIKSGKKVSYTKKNLKKGKKYYYKVRAYKTVNGKKIYGAFSSVKSVKIKK